MQLIIMLLIMLEVLLALLILVCMDTQLNYIILLIEIILAVNRLRTTVLSNSDFIRNFANRVTGPSGYISQGETYIDIGSQYIRTYDTPRYHYDVLLLLYKVF